MPRVLSCSGPKEKEEMPEVPLVLTVCEGLIWRDTLSQHSLSILGGSGQRQPENQLLREGGVGYMTCGISSSQADMELIHPQLLDGMHGMDVIYNKSLQQTVMC